MVLAQTNRTSFNLVRLKRTQFFRVRLDFCQRRCRIAMCNKNLLRPKEGQRWGLRGSTLVDPQLAGRSCHLFHYRRSLDAFILSLSAYQWRKLVLLISQPFDLKSAAHAGLPAILTTPPLRSYYNRARMKDRKAGQITG